MVLQTVNSKSIPYAPPKSYKLAQYSKTKPFTCLLERPALKSSEQSAGDATRHLPPTTSALTAAPPPRPPTCLNSPNDALSATSPRQLKLWRKPVRRPNGRGPASTSAGRPIRPKLGRLHERPNGPDGLPGRAESRDGRAGVHGAKRTLSLPPSPSQMHTCTAEMLNAKQINRYVSIPALKHYFNVSTPYVLRKLLLVLFPWRHKPWSREQRPSASSQDPTTGANAAYSYYFLPPRDDLNSPDMYIPVMAFVTYILLSTLLAGLRGTFHPEVMGTTAGAAFAVVAVEILGLKFGTYILSISNDSQLLDLVAYSGYKFVGVIVTLVVAEMFNRGRGTGGWAGWTVFTYTFLANAFFLLRSLKYVLLPDSSSSTPAGGMQTVARSQRNRRTQFLFLYSYVVQFVFMWVLSRQESARLLG